MIPGKAERCGGRAGTDPRAVARVGLVALGAACQVPLHLGWGCSWSFPRLLPSLGLRGRQSRCPGAGRYRAAGAAPNANSGQPGAPADPPELPRCLPRRVPALLSPSSVIWYQRKPGDFKGRRRLLINAGDAYCRAGVQTASTICWGLN